MPRRRPAVMPEAARPAWCGSCDRYSRQVFLDAAGTAARCPRCHPLTQPATPAPSVPSAPRITHAEALQLWDDARG